MLQHPLAAADRSLMALAVDEVNLELRLRLLRAGRISLVCSPVGALSVLALVGGNPQRPLELIWVVFACLAGPLTALSMHLELNGRLKIRRSTHTLLAASNPLIAQSFVLAFRPAGISREAMLESLIATVLCVAQLVTFSANRTVTRFALGWTVMVLITGGDALSYLPVHFRFLLMVPVALTFLQMTEVLHRQQRSHIELGFENERLIEDLQAANTQLGRELILDPLTGLMNRVGLYRELERTRPVALLYVDVDHFKRVNDTFGHSKGDQVLQLLGDALREVTRSVDVVARIGGDEFIVLLDDANETIAKEVARRLQLVVQSMVDLVGVTVSVGAACGVIGAENGDTLIARADSALYESKRAGGDRFSLA
jgi:diguanylate cyclase (GGDEF)-like protein